MSKQPLFKTAAANLPRIGASDGTTAPAPTTAASRPVTADVPATVGGPTARAQQLRPVAGGVR